MSDLDLAALAREVAKHVYSPVLAEDLPLFVGLEAAALAALQRAVEAERASCADLAESRAPRADSESVDTRMIWTNVTAREIAAAIRARGGEEAK